MTDLGLDRYAAELDDMVGRLAAAAARIGPGRAVPTCPEWTARDLVGHVGTGHRWAAGTRWMLAAARSVASSGRALRSVDTIFCRALAVAVAVFGYLALSGGPATQLRFVGSVAGTGGAKPPTVVLIMFARDRDVARDRATFDAVVRPARLLP